MSAICGICQISGQPVHKQNGMKMMQQLQKYPADCIGTWSEEQIFLGSHAQWVTPESVHEPLPYYDYTRQLAITSDAVIDNRQELFDRLQIPRENRKGMPDSQLILLSSAKWGEEAPKHLVGDFAFAVWDEKSRKLFAARDFSGTRTLYFHRTQDTLSFSTVIEPLLHLPGIERKINDGWMAEYLTIPWNFETVDLSTTIYRNISQIPPAHSLTFYNGTLKLKQYIHISSEKTIRYKKPEEYEEAFREVFGRAVGDRLRTVYKVGSHLSGGLDSGSVSSLAGNMLRVRNQKLYSYSYIPVRDFTQWTSKSRLADETPNIMSLVQFNGNIEPRFLDFKDKNPFSEIDDWLDVLEFPYKFYENSFWLKGIFEEASKEGIRTLLTGQRGNWTVSWGHALDFQAKLLKEFDWIRLYKEVRQYSRRTGIKKANIMPIIRRKAFPSISGMLSRDRQDPYPTIVNPELAGKFDTFRKLREEGIDLTGNKVKNAFEMKKEQFEKLYYWNVNGTYSTKLSLRHSILDRDPTNDLRVVQFCQAVPETQFVREGQDRSLIRRAMEGILPDDIRLNFKTRGIQGSDGLHRMLPEWDAFMAEMAELCKNPVSSYYLNIKEIKKAIDQVGKRPLPEKIFDDDFRIMMRSLIFYRFIKKLA